MNYLMRTLALLLATTTFAVDYTWTGAVDGSWTNAANWDGNGVPVDNQAGTGNAEGLTMIYTDTVNFSGTTMPTSNAPDIGGNFNGNRDTPTMLFNSGGSISFAVVGSGDGFWTNTGNQTRNILTVGDGIGGGTEDVQVTLTSGNARLHRHADGTHIFEVRSDGTLTFDYNLDFRYNANRRGVIRVNGGTVVVNGTVSDLFANTAYVDFASVAAGGAAAGGGSFTADYGGSFADIAAVNAAITAGTILIARTGGLTATDNGGSFTVTHAPLEWTGAAGDGDWTNTVNWVGGAIPVDTVAGTGNNEGLTLLYSDSITFSGTNMPTTNVPDMGGVFASVGDTPSLVLNSGGSFAFDVVGHEDALWTNTTGITRNILTVGDGIGGGTEDVAVNIPNMGSQLMRHSNGTHIFEVNSDGTLTLNDNIDFRFNASRTAIFQINGGTVTVNGTISDLNAGTAYVELGAEGGTFTADFGGSFANISTVLSGLGTLFTRTSGDLTAVDNGDGSFTVRPFYEWTGTAGDGNWNNTSNWFGGLIPVDNAPGTGNNAGLSLRYNDVITFSGTNLPSVNVPGLGGDAATNEDTPTLVINSGGTINWALVGRETEIWSNTDNTRTVFTVGDGVEGGTEDVVLNLTHLSDLMRHADTHNNYAVNSDGTLNITSTSGTLRFSYNNLASRTSSFTINGGTVVANSQVQYLINHAANFVEFTDVGGSFTATYGADFADIAAVTASLGLNFLNNAGTGVLKAVDNGGSFTVSLRDPGTVVLVR